MKSQTAFGQFSLATNQPFFTVTLLFLRLAFGIQFLLAGVSKLGDWSAESYLQAATGPFANFFISLAGNPIVDWLVIIGEIMIGLGLILGLFIRPASFFAAILIILFFLSGWNENTAHGFVEWHLIYVLVLVLFLAGGVGHIFGLDGLLYQNLGKQRRRLVNLLFG